MSFKNTNTSQCSDDLKDAISEADFNVDGETEKNLKKKETKKFLFKKESKEKGYASLVSGDQNQDSVFLVGTKSSKKAKQDAKKSSLQSVFKKSFKDETKRLKEIKENKEEQMNTTTKRKTKLKSNSEQNQKHKENLFGNSLESSVSSFMANDGVKVPYPIRICIDIIEQKGIELDNIYRHHVNKSQLETICESINNEAIETKMDELNSDPHLACAIIKKFLKELKTPIIPDDILPFIDRCESSDKEQKIDNLKKCLIKLPEANYETFCYLIMHFHKVLDKNESNKIEIGLFLQKFQPIFRIKERVFKFIILNANLLFNEFRFKKYRVNKLIDETLTRFSFIPDSIEDLEQEIAKQEIYLSKLHNRIANEEHMTNKSIQEELCEELWALQRYVTSLKRKVKKLKSEKKPIEPKIVEKETESSTIVDQSQQHDLNELINKEINMVCENSVLIESVQQLFERILKENIMINDLISKYGVLSSVYPISDLSQFTIQELYEKEQLIMNDNKLLEERINLINKRILNEKEKIFDLKLNIKLKTIEQAKLDNILLLNNTNKELVMTKL